nr:MAG TPA: hypothetical protein [Caudoviricetes sp.]
MIKSLKSKIFQIFSTMGTRLSAFFKFPAIWYIYGYIDICMYKPTYG